MVDASMSNKHAERAALLILKEATPELTRQQASTIRGQILKGEIYAAMRGLHRILQATDGAKKARDMDRNVPCYKCEIRYPGCHAVCMKYEAYALARKVKRHTEQTNRIADEVLILSCQRELKRRRKRQRR